MLIIYNIGIKLYYFFAIIASLVNTKAKAWVNGRKAQKVIALPKSIWFHFASLGEFEQGRPVLEAVKAQYPDQKIVITFFSPSGYEIRKNTPLANAVYYLPLDTAQNAQQFINTIKPAAVIFTKYEYWYHYFNELHKQQIPLYVISAIFRPKQIFFKWYGSLHRNMLTKVTRFFVQDEASQKLLSTIGISSNVQVSGDTRFDRVYANAQQPKTLPIIRDFKNNLPVFIAGSTWPADEELLVQLIDKYPDWKFIFAPHEIPEDKVSKLISLLPAGKAIRFSQIPVLSTPLLTYQVLVIDNIGMLSSLYQYGEIAYIGGGFGVGIHNTLEAAAFGLPVIFGPNYSRFKEARDLVALQAGFSIANEQQLQETADKLITAGEYRHKASIIAKQFVNESKGATEIIMSNIVIL
jgi:3-deoxy-D-manno-octulosonic-acid transferase